ncbi:virion protein [Bovine papular stomatitis virus]
MASDRIAQRTQSSYDDYIQTLNKIAPQLRSLLTHLNSEHVVRGGATGDEACAGGSLEAVSSRRGSSSRAKSRTSRSSTKTTSSSSRSRRSGAPARRGDGGSSISSSGMRACDAETVQAVSNCGRIVYGVMKDGKLEVHGTMGDVCEDLLGVESVNAGRKNASRSRTTKTTCTGSRSGTCTSSTSRRRSSGTSSSSSSSASRRRRAPELSTMNSVMDLDGGMC